MMDSEALPTVQDNKEESSIDSKVPGKEAPPSSVAVLSAAPAGVKMGVTQASNQRDPDKSKAQLIKETLEVAGKMLIGLAGLCYVLGLIVVTIHLRRYGLNSLTLSQLHYVTAGVWILLPSLVMMFFLGFAKFVFDAQDWKTKPDEPKWPKVFAVVVVLFSALCSFYFVAEYLMRKSLGIPLTMINWVVIPLLGTFAFALMAAVINIFLTNSTNHRRDSTQTDRKDSKETGRGESGNSIKRSVIPGLVLPGLYALGLSALYITLFAGYTYRAIPWATGGGQPSQVKLIVSTEAKPYLASAGINFPADPNRRDSEQNQTDSLQLLLVTEKEYVIVIPDGRAVSVPVDLVKAVIYEK